MYLPITIIFSLGLVVVVIFSAVLSRIFFRKTSRTYAEIEQQYRNKQAASDELERTALAALADGKDLRPTIDRWQQARTAEFPDKGWRWRTEDLKAARTAQLSTSRRELTNELLFRAILGIASLLTVFGGVALVVYAYYAYQGPTLPASPQPAWNDPGFMPASNSDPADPQLPTPPASPVASPATSPTSEPPQASPAPADSNPTSFLARKQVTA